MGAATRPARRVGLPGRRAVRLWLRQFAVAPWMEHGGLRPRPCPARRSARLVERDRRWPLDGRLPGAGILPPLSGADRFAGALRHAGQRRFAGGAGRAAAVQKCGDGEGIGRGRREDGAELFREGELRLEPAARRENAGEHRPPSAGGDQRSDASHRRAEGFDGAADRNRLPGAHHQRHGGHRHHTGSRRRNARLDSRLKARTDSRSRPPLEPRPARDVQRHIAGAFAKSVKKKNPQPVWTGWGGCVSSPV